jgi:hypothetical protein
MRFTSAFLTILLVPAVVVADGGFAYTCGDLAVSQKIGINRGRQKKFVLANHHSLTLEEGDWYLEAYCTVSGTGGGEVYSILDLNGCFANGGGELYASTPSHTL